MENTWFLLSREQKEPVGVMTDRFIMKFDRFMDWNLLSSNYDFSIDMLRMYQHRVNWAQILKRKLFPETFLQEMVTNFNDCWGTVSRYQILSESFIHDFAENVDWEDIILYQNVSGKFLNDHYSPEEHRIPN